VSGKFYPRTDCTGYKYSRWQDLVKKLGCPTLVQCVNFRAVLHFSCEEVLNIDSGSPRRAVKMFLGENDISLRSLMMIVVPVSANSTEMT